MPPEREFNQALISLSKAIDNLADAWKQNAELNQFIGRVDQSIKDIRYNITDLQKCNALTKKEIADLKVQQSRKWAYLVGGGLIALAGGGGGTLLMRFLSL